MASKGKWEGKSTGKESRIFLIDSSSTRRAGREIRGPQFSKDGELTCHPKVD